MLSLPQRWLYHTSEQGQACSLDTLSILSCENHSVALHLGMWLQITRWPQTISPALTSILPRLPRWTHPSMPLIQQVRKKNLTEVTELLSWRAKESQALYQDPWNAKGLLFPVDLPDAITNFLGKSSLWGSFSQAICSGTSFG